MTRPGRVLVTGADQHQGLAVIRGLGRAGIRVLAAGSEPRSLGFSSRYTAVALRHTSPFADPARCRAELLAMIEANRPEVVIPSVEATLVLLNEVRDALPAGTRLAAPASDILEYALDKGRTLELAARCGVPAPRTARGDSIEAILADAASLRFPLAIKPRGHALHVSTANALGFKSRYAATPAELHALLSPFARDGKALLVQEYARGVGRCVSAVCDHGRPLALFAYERIREVPLTGGVSVLRRSIPLDAPLEQYTIRLLGELRWHGVAMVEFKFDAATGRYTLMEINGRFQASTALSLDAGLNLPHLVAALFAETPLPPVPPYRVGVEERWLRGDLAALAGVWRHGAPPVIPGAEALPGRLRSTWRFLRDFRPGVHHDEFEWEDWRPGITELRGLIGVLWSWLVARAASVWRRVAPPSPLRRVTSASTQRSIRA